MTKKYIDIKSGDMYGKLLVIAYVGLNKKRCVIWECKCQCGNLVKVSSSRLKKSEQSLSCGCSKKEETKLQKCKERLGKTFGQWTVLAYLGTDSRRRVIWECASLDGIKKQIRDDVLKGLCSSIHKNKIGRENPNYKHGMSFTRVYAIWEAMKARCATSGDYSKRGILVCDKWRESFAAFHADMGDPPSTKHSIDRIDNDGNYTPDNCRWATQKVQLNNTSRNRRITIGDETKNMQEWCDQYKINPSTLWCRLDRGIRAEDALLKRRSKSDT